MSAETYAAVLTEWKRINVLHFFLFYPAMLLSLWFRMGYAFYPAASLRTPLSGTRAFFIMSYFLEAYLGKVVSQSAHLLRLVLAALARDCTEEGVLWAELHVCGDRYSEAALESIARVLDEFETPKFGIVYDIQTRKGLDKLRIMRKSSVCFRKVCVGVGYGHVPSYMAMGGQKRANLRAAIHTYAKRNDLIICPHLGEFDSLDQDDIPHVDRIGHGIRAVDSRDAISALIKHDVCLEINPICNVITNASKDFATHPLRELLDAGVARCINSDDPALLGASNSADMYRNLRVVVNDMRIPDEQVKEMLLNSWRYSAAPNEMKERAMAALCLLSCHQIREVLG